MYRHMADVTKIIPALHSVAGVQAMCDAGVEESL